MTKNNSIRILTNIDFVKPEDNIIYKVAVFLKEKYNVSSGVEITLEKKIPVEAGLGGGSSNAATTITALSELWELGLSDMEMQKTAALFGSDLNFFLTGGTALGEGRGELITPLKDLIIDNVLLVKPEFGISSREAYELAEPSKEHNQDWRELLDTADVNLCYNGLEQKILERYQEVRQIRDLMLEHGAIKSILSGSGPTVIGFFSDPYQIRNSAEYFGKNNYWNCITKTKERSTL